MKKFLAGLTMAFVSTPAIALSVPETITKNNAQAVLAQQYANYLILREVCTSGHRRGRVSESFPTTLPRIKSQTMMRAVNNKISTDFPEIDSRCRVEAYWTHGRRSADLQVAITDPDSIALINITAMNGSGIKSLQTVLCNISASVFVKIAQLFLRSTTHRRKTSED
jgi:hypothetical protein